MRTQKYALYNVKFEHFLVFMDIDKQTARISKMDHFIDDFTEVFIMIINLLASLQEFLKSTFKNRNEFL